MKKQLNLSKSKIQDCRKMAKKISAPVFDLIEEKSSWSIERATLRLYGVDDALKQSGLDYPLCNAVVDELRKSKMEMYGVTPFWIYAKSKHPSLAANDLARVICERPADYFHQQVMETYPKLAKLAEKETREAINHLLKVRDDRYKL